MLTLLLALSAQTATLPASARDAGVTCAAAMLTLPGATESGSAAPMSHVLMLAAREVPGPQNLLERAVALRSEADKLSLTMKGPVTAILAECRARFPRAWVTSGVRLPSDSFERRMMCVSATSFLSGLTRTDTSPERKEWVGQLGERFQDLVLADLQPRGLDSTEKLVDAMIRALDSSLERGNMIGVATACDAAFPA